MSESRGAMWRQYVAAEKHKLTLSSLDADFDRTERGRKTPADVLKELQETPGKQGRQAMPLRNSHGRFIA